VTTIDDLLTDTSIPITSTPFDVGAALRRLAADTDPSTPARDMARATRAAQQLSVICRWVLNTPDAAAQIDRLARDPDSDSIDDLLEAGGALVFACVLYLTNYRESAQFWWQLAAGADRRTAAYCLHLHHLSLGEEREARHWFHQVTDTLLDSETEAPDEVFLSSMKKLTDYVRTTGCTRASAPTGGLEMEINRLAALEAGSCIIVHRPDQRLVAELREFSATTVRTACWAAHKQ
jgi:hypothetical protein